MGFLFASVVLYLVFATRERWDPVHPVVWYTPFIILYSFSAVFIHHRGHYKLDHPDEVSLIGFLAVSSGLIGISVVDWWIESGSKWVPKVNISLDKISLLVSFYGVLVLSLIYMGYVYASGVSSKPDLLRSDIIYLGVLYGVVNTFSLLTIVRSVMRRGQVPVLPVVITIATFLAVVLVLGQRNPILRYFIGVTLILYGFGILEKWQVYTVGISILVSIPLMGLAKAYVLSGKLGELNESLPLSILTGEFRSAGRNMDTLLSRAGEWEYRHGGTVITDVLRGVVPAPIHKFQNPTNWFRNELHPELASKGMGPGFTFAGEGFINFGYIGVVVWFFLVSILIVYLYKHRKSSLLLYITYVSSVPIFIYSLRADIANILSPVLKHVVVPLLMLGGLSTIVKRYVCPTLDGIHSRSITGDDLPG
ncbi:O-antigen polysaccharide polymerase Wzy family protein [Salinibacter sp.]|uniref:O-antigen polysaccharide polymerase Wzy family protein n=1 Tax=Salinibacter sp. TaxID=2065818 RepID=UPI0021E8FE68|nr:O-antigen polysaccharide polymerase Wzy family protein [Salinibacter sp.]